MITNETKAARLEARNRALAEMTPGQRRVEVAKDALAQLKAEKIVAMGNLYLRDEEGQFIDEAITQEMVDAMPRCMACAVGTFFVTCVRKYDALAPDVVLDSMYDEGMREYLTPFFDRKQLAQIEYAFERGYTSERGLLSEEELETAQAFGSRFETDHSRLIAILNNIIENGREFIP